MKHEILNWFWIIFRNNTDAVSWCQQFDYGRQIADPYQHICSYFWPSFSKLTDTPDQPVQPVQPLLPDQKQTNSQTDRPVSNLLNKLRPLAIPNQNGPSHLKFNKKFVVQILSNSKSKNQIGFWIKIDDNQSQILIKIGLFWIKSY